MNERVQGLRLKLAGILPFMNEKQRRIIAAAEAKSYGRGGIQTLARITGISRQTIYRGLEDLETAEPTPRVRKPGGGRKKLSQHNPQIIQALEALIEPSTRGDPESLLRWTCKSVRNLEADLKEAGYAVSHATAATSLR